MGIDWEKQPRNPETGRWLEKKYPENRNRMLQIRLTGDEMEQIYRAAAVRGMTVTAYVVECCKAGLPGSWARTAAAAGSPLLEHKKRLAARKRRRGY